jgi:hypothetical protein
MKNDKKEKDITSFQKGLEELFKHLKEQARQLLDGVSAEEFNRQPRPGVWSMAENLEHLNVTGEEYMLKVDEVIEAVEAGTKPPGKPIDSYGVRFMMRKFIDSMEPPVKRKFKAPNVFQPSSDLDKDQTLKHFTAFQDMLVEKLGTVIRLNLLKHKITSPATRMLTLQLGEAFVLIAAHERRHLSAINNSKLSIDN